MFTLVIIMIIITLFFLYYLNCVYQSKYWASRGVPTPNGDLFRGHLGYLSNTQYPSVLQIKDWTKKYGKIYGYREGGRQVLVISDPEMVHELLIKKFECFYGRKNHPLVGNVDTEKMAHVFTCRGARWKRLRTICASSFSVSNLKKMIPTVDDSVSEMMIRLEKAANLDQAFNIHPYFHELTMDVICKIALGQRRSKQFENPYVDICKKVFADFGIDTFSTLALLMPWEWSVWVLRRLIFLMASLRKAPFKELFASLYKEIEQRRKIRANNKKVEMTNRIDFIDLFLDTEVQGGRIKALMLKIVNSLVEESAIFMRIFGPFDTTANTLALTMFFLAKDLHRQKLVQNEIDEICQDEQITYEQLQQLKYADAVMKETLRLVPIAGFAASRECHTSTRLGSILIEKGTFVQADVFSLHHDKEIWGENVEEFVPERFLNNENRHPCSYIPFGGGPRTCIGMKLAYMEEKLSLVKILKIYNVIATEQTEKKIKLVGASILNPEAITIKLIRRK